MPHDFYSMDIEDAALMFKGYFERQEWELNAMDLVGMRVAATISDVTNRSFGGKGAYKQVTKAWKHAWDQSSKTGSIAEEKLAKRKLQAEQLKRNNGNRKS